MFKYLIKEIFAEKTRVWLTIMAIAWGTLSISLMLATGQGVMETFTTFINKLGSHMIVVSGGKSTLAYQGRSGGVLVQLDKTDMTKIKRLPGVSAVYPEYIASTSMSHDGLTTNFTAIHGVNQGYQNTRKIPLSAGRFINHLDVVNRNPVIVLGAEVVPGLFTKKQKVVGQSIQIGSGLFKVIGITSDESQLGAYQTPDKYLTFIPSSVFTASFHPKGISNLLVIYNSQVSDANLKTQIRDLVAMHYHLNPKDKGIVNYFDNQKNIEQVTSFFMGVKFFLGLVGVITFLVASLGIANIMYVELQRAMPEIGIIMACGARSWDIVKLYFLESLLVTAIGGAIGLFLAFLCILIGNYFLLGLTNILLKGLQLSLSWELTLAVIIVLLFVGGLAGIFPAIKAARIQPVEALRHE